MVVLAHGNKIRDMTQFMDGNLSLNTLSSGR